MLTINNTFLLRKRYHIYLRFLQYSLTSLHLTSYVPVQHVPASPRPILDVPKSLVSRPWVKSPHTRVLMSLSQFYTQPKYKESNYKQYVAQYPASTSNWPLETKTQFLQRPLYFSVNKAFRMEAEYFSFKMQVLAGLQLEKQQTESATLFRCVNFLWLIFTLFTAQQN